MYRMVYVIVKICVMESYDISIVYIIESNITLFLDRRAASKMLYFYFFLRRTNNVFDNYSIIYKQLQVLLQYDIYQRFGHLVCFIYKKLRARYSLLYLYKKNRRIIRHMFSLILMVTMTTKSVRNKKRLSMYLEQQHIYVNIGI